MSLLTELVLIKRLGFYRYCTLTARTMGYPEAWLGEAVDRCGANLLRLKAIIAVKDEDRPVAIHVVQHVIHRPEYLTAWPDGLRQGRISVIGQGIEPAFLNRMLDDLAD